MAFRHRKNGQAFTCANRWYRTNTNRGKPHGRGKARGSVFGKPLLRSGGLTLWLEHVKDKRDNSDVFWLMWYDESGSPTIPMSGVFDVKGIKEIARQLAAFIRLQ